jgi:hypothetical protein
VGWCKACERAYYESRKRKDPARYLYFRVKYRAKTDGIVFELEPSDIFIPEFCPVLGLRLSPVWAPQGDEAKPSLDRLDPTKGYVRGNVTVISLRANRIKTDATAEEHERIAAWMRARGPK